MLDLLISSPILILYFVPVIIFSLSFHEFAHAYTFYKLGDNTARYQGRLTLNPINHLDPLGTIMLFLAGFGWAKPVPINPIYYKDRKKGTMIVSLAGPLSNVLVSFISAIPLAYILHRNGVSLTEIFQSQYLRILETNGIESILFNYSFFFYYINLNLAIFNLLPVPPLDGSKILSGILPVRHYFKLMEYERYIGIILIIIVFLKPGLLFTIMSPFRWAISSAFVFIINPIMNLIG